MKNNQKTYWILGIGLLLTLVVLAIIFGNSRKSVSWREHYIEESKDPYGTFLVQNLLEAYFSDYEVELMRDSIDKRLENAQDGSNYLFVGETLFMDSLSEERLFEFVEKGNKAFIFSKSIPFNVSDKLFGEYCFVDEYNPDYDFFYDSIAHFDFIHPDLNYQEDSTGFSLTFEKDFENEGYYWSYIPNYLLCEESFPAIASLGICNDSLVNFVEATFGDGAFYFHTNPILFTNYSLNKEDGLEYSNRVFAHLNEGTIYWDQRSRLPWNADMDWWMAQKKTFNSEGPLKYILAQPPLAWAWYLGLAIGLLYLIFRAKRRQRVIPVLEKNKNTSLEFISTIGRLYFIQNNHRKLAHQKIKLWKGFIRDHYKLSTKEMNVEFANQLVNKSEVSKELVDKILLMNRNIKNSDFLSEKALIDFHNLMDKFYKTCK